MTIRRLRPIPPRRARSAARRGCGIHGQAGRRTAGAMTGPAGSRRAVGQGNPEGRGPFARRRRAWPRWSCRPPVLRFPAFPEQGLTLLSAEIATHSTKRPSEMGWSNGCQQASESQLSCGPAPSGGKMTGRAARGRNRSGSLRGGRGLTVPGLRPMAGRPVWRLLQPPLHFLCVILRKCATLAVGELEGGSPCLTPRRPTRSRRS